MSECQFVKSQRVTVPVACAGAEDIQGVVTSIQTFIGREPEVSYQWLSSDTAGPSLLLIVHVGSSPESVLLAAQPPKMMPVEDVAKLCTEAREEGAREVRAVISAERDLRAATRRKAAKPAARKRR